MTAQSPEQIEIDRLRAHNLELLGEAKAAKAEAKAAGESLVAMTAERDQATAEVQRVTLDGPIDALLGDIGIDAGMMRMALERYGYRFTREDGRLTMRDADGNVPTLPDGPDGSRDIAVTAGDLRAYLSEAWTTPDKRSDQGNAFAALIKAPHATGGGAMGVRGGQGSPSPAKPQAVAPSSLGLR